MECSKKIKIAFKHNKRREEKNKRTRGREGGCRRKTIYTFNWLRTDISSHFFFVSAASKLENDDESDGKEKLFA